MRLCTALLSLLLAAPVAAQKSSLRQVASDLELRPATVAGAEALELRLPDVASGRTQRRAVSDMMLRLVVPGGDARAALNLGNGLQPDRDAGLFRAKVYVVVGGRLLAPAEARCDRWIEDLAVCATACDGGMFGLRRRQGPGGASLSLVVGRLPRDMEEGGHTGFAIDACAAPETPEQIVAPAGNRPLVEIALAAR